MVRTAWKADPKIAFEMINRFKGMEELIITELRSLLNIDPVAATVSCDAVPILLMNSAEHGRRVIFYFLM
jgi:hypothetical protein